MHTISSIFTGRSAAVSRPFAKAFLVTSFVLMTSLGAYVRIPLPFSPVPITLQTFFVILGGAMLGRKLGALSQFSYLTLGAFGLPVFQGYASGLFHIFGPTGGYLAGFVPAAFIVGKILERKNAARNFARITLAMAAGLFTIYFFGISWLMISMRVGLTTAIFLGFTPFIPGALVKLIAAASIYRKIGTRVDEII